MEAEQFIVCLGFNETYEYFSPVFFALMESKTEEAYIRLHQSVKNISTSRFHPSKWTVDFERAHINVRHLKLIFS